MKLLRFLALVAVVLAAYLAQYLFDYRSLEPLFLSSNLNRVLTAIPILTNLLYWPPDRYLILAGWLLFVASIAFGLIVPQWNRAAPTAFSPQPNLLRLTDKRYQRNLWLPISYFVLALTSAFYCLGYLAAGGTESYFLQTLWGASLLFYLVKENLMKKIIFRLI